MAVEIYIDDEEETVIVGKPNFEYEIVHTEYDPLTDKKKIWVKRKKHKDPRENLPWTDPRRHP